MLSTRSGREVDRGELLDDLVQEVLLGHAGDLLIEREPLHDLADVARKAVDVGVEVGRELVGVVEELGQVQPRQVVEGAAGDLLEQTADDRLGLDLDARVRGEDLGLGRRQQAVETAQHRQGQDDLAVLVALVGPAQQVADAPDEVGELGVAIGAQWDSRSSVTRGFRRQYT